MLRKLASQPWPVLAQLSTLCYLAIALDDSRRGLDVANYLIFYSVAFAIYLVALLMLLRAARASTSKLTSELTAPPPEHAQPPALIRPSASNSFASGGSATRGLTGPPSADQEQERSAESFPPQSPHRKPDLPRGRTMTPAFPSLTLIWAVAVVFRIALLLSPPTLSDDVYRYIWDGHVGLHGVNPYAHEVTSPALDDLAIPARSLVNNASMASPYLPAAQLVFSYVALVAPQSPRAFQIMMTALDLLAGILLMQILARIGLRREFVLAYLWNPLVVAEFANGAHVDALMIALTLAALSALLARKSGWSAVLLGLATLTKGLPALLLCVVWPRWRPRHWLAYLGVVGGLTLPYILGAGLGLAGERTGTGLFGAIRIYDYEWNYNGGIYHWLEGVTTGVHSAGAVPPETPGAQTARRIAGAGTGLVMVLTAWQARKVSDDAGLLRLSLLPFAGYLLLTTTVHPWYVTILAPFATLELARSTERSEPGNGLLWIPIIYWTWSVALAYVTYLDPSHIGESAVARLLEYVPLYLLILGTIAWARGRRRNSAAPASTIGP